MGFTENRKQKNRLRYATLLHYAISSSSDQTFFLSFFSAIHRTLVLRREVETLFSDIQDVWFPLLKHTHTILNPNIYK